MEAKSSLGLGNAQETDDVCEVNARPRNGSAPQSLPIEALHNVPLHHTGISSIHRIFYRRLVRFVPIAVFLFALGFLAYGIQEHEIASAYTDPIAKIRAQDESIYTSSSITMATQGDWLTPRFLGRLLLYKPPLLIWLSALSVKVFGESLFALRLPSLLAALLATMLLFYWVRQSRSLSAAVFCALLLLGNPLWHVFAKLSYTDMLFVACFASALWTIHKDHWLDLPRTRWLFVTCCACGILAKNVAGLLPIIVWVLFAVWSKEAGQRLSWRRVAEVVAGVILFTAPWHVYQMAVHPQWFWADYVQVQLLGFGLKPPAQSSHETQLWFYAKRLFLTDPLLILFTVAAVPAFVAQLRQKQKRADALLIASWLLVMILSLALFRYRNLPYVLALIPALALLASLYSPGRSWRVAVVAVALLIKVVSPGEVYGLPLTATEPIPSASALKAYADRGRSNDLIVVAPDDEFYSATLGLPAVRYAFVDPNGVVVNYAPHLAYLGVTVSVEQFLAFNSLRDQYAARLKQWGAKSSEALGTAIVADSTSELERLIASRSQTDFFLPGDVFDSLPVQLTATHDIRPAANGRVFLLARPATSSRLTPRP